MMNALNTVDHNISLWLHHIFRNEMMDQWMWYVSKNEVIAIVFLVCTFFIYRHYNLKNVGLAVLTIIVAIGGADFIVTNFFKPIFCRLRPSHDPLIQHSLETVNNYIGGQYGFVSGHAATNMAGIVVVVFMLKKHYQPYIFILFLWVLIVSYSRIYLGVHFFGDVIGGIVVGFFWAYLVIRFLYQPIKKKKLFIE